MDFRCKNVDAGVYLGKNLVIIESTKIYYTGNIRGARGRKIIFRQIDLIQSRKDNLLNYYCSVYSVKRAKQGFWISAAHFDRYEKTGAYEHLKVAKEMFHVSINSIVSCFGLIGGLYNFHRFRHLYDDDMRNEFKEVFTKTNLYNKERYTANHLLMSVISRYLAEELYPGEIKTNIFNDDPSCEKILERIINEYVHEGDPEWNSGTYFAMHFVPLWMLGEFADNEEIKNKGRMAAEWLIVKAAATWLHGYWAIPQERVYKPFAAQNQYGAGTVILMIMFGGAAPENYDDSEAHFAIPIAISDYTPPKIISEIIKEKSSPYHHKERHFYHLRDRIHFYDPNLSSEGRMPIENDVFLTSYINKTFALFSSVERVKPREEYLEFMDRYYIQMHRWGVCFTGRPGPSVFYMEHPCGVKVENSGATAWERVMQYESTLIGIYNIPSDRKPRYLEHFLAEDLRKYPQQLTDTKLRPHNRFIIGYIPTNYDKCINRCAQGRIYLDYGDFMLALFLSSSFDWNSCENTFRRETEKLAFVVEISDAYDRLDEFMDMVDSKFDNVEFDDENLTLVYESIGETEMKMKFISDGTREDYIDGISVDYDKWPLIKNPWVKQEFRGEELLVEYNCNHLIYDYKKWTIKE